MMIMLIVVATVSAALMIGAAWGVFGSLSTKWEGFLIALSGGALIVSLVNELIEPAIEQSNLLVALSAVLVGAITFTICDYWIDQIWGADGGAGLLAAIVMDGIPENLALGVALIGAGVPEVAALAGSIFLSNLPEAAGGAKEMSKKGRSKSRVIAIWAAAAIAMAAAAIVGNLAMAAASEHLFAATRCFAAGAVVASLATEVFPKAYKDDHHMAGIATVLGVVLAFLLCHLGG